MEKIDESRGPQKVQLPRKGKSLLLSQFTLAFSASYVYDIEL